MKPNTSRMAVVAQVAPTRTINVYAQIMDEHWVVVDLGDLDSGDLDHARPYAFGIPDVGWVDVVHEPPKDDHLPMRRWFRILAEHPLPAHMKLSSYDVGHQVVVTTGEFLGVAGPVTGLLDYPGETSSPSWRDSVILEGGAAHLSRCVGALMPTDTDAMEELAPLRVRCPPGARVWVWVKRAWEAAVVSGYAAGRVEAWLVQDETVAVVDRSRLRLRARHDDVPPPNLRMAPDRNAVRRAPVIATRQRLMSPPHLS